MNIKNKITNVVLAKEDHIAVVGRIGYAARAVVYGLIGIFAALLMFQEGGALTDTRGILVRLLNQPFGQFILGTIAAGLFFFSFWRIMQALRDYENKGTSPKGIAARLGYGFSALAYATLGYYAINLIFRLSHISKESSEKQFAQTLMGQSFGVVLLGLVAFLILGIGLFQIYRAVKEKFKKGLDLPSSYHWLFGICKIGITARGIVFCIIGWLFLRAALHANSNEAGGLTGVWTFLEDLPYGSFLVAAMAIGMIAFSVYGFTEAFFRRHMNA